MQTKTEIKMKLLKVHNEYALNRRFIGIGVVFCGTFTEALFILCNGVL